MPVPKTLILHRRGSRSRALITLSGEMDLYSAPVVRESLARCLRDGVRVIDIDLTDVTFCDCHGLGVFLEARRHAIANGGSLRLRHPRPELSRLLDLAGVGPLLLGPRFRLLPLAALRGRGGSRSNGPPRATPPDPGTNAATGRHGSRRRGA
jgi:anti-sigma B factor antagonist